MYKMNKVKFKRYDRGIEKLLNERYKKANEFDFASKCAIALSRGIEPTKVYLDNKGMFIANGGNYTSSSEIFSSVMSLMKDNSMF